MMTTYTGRHVNLLDFKDSDIDIRDIAHHLALTNRWNGASKVPMNVAHHSVLCSMLCPTHPLDALLHDASEAYAGDVIRWLKRTTEMAGFRVIEDRIQMIIAMHFGIKVEMPPQVKAIDDLLVRCEGHFLFDEDPIKSTSFPMPPTASELAYLQWDGKPWTWEYSEYRFLRAFEKLKKT
jgi:uncharacterized protein